MFTEQECLKNAEELEKTADLLSVVQDKVALRARAQSWREKAAERAADREIAVDEPRSWGFPQSRWPLHGRH